MTGSARLVSMPGLHALVRRAGHRLLVARLLACPFSPYSRGRIGDVPGVPRHQRLDAVGHGDGDVRGIRGSFARNRPEFKKPARASSDPYRPSALTPTYGRISRLMEPCHARPGTDERRTVAPSDRAGTRSGPRNAARRIIPRGMLGSEGTTVRVERASRTPGARRHPWSRHDVVAWDSRAAMHKTVPDHDDGDHRCMRRTTIAKSAPRT